MNQMPAAAPAGYSAPTQSRLYSQTEQNTAQTSTLSQHHSGQVLLLHPYQHAQQHPPSQHTTSSSRPANHSTRAVLQVGNTTGAPIYASQPGQPQTYPQEQQQQQPHPYGSTRLTHGYPFPAVADPTVKPAVEAQVERRPPYTIPDPARASNSRQPVLANNAAVGVSQQNTASVVSYHPEQVQVANRRAQAAVQKFGEPLFNALWKSMHEMVSMEFLDLSTGYSRKIEKLRNDVMKARQSEQQAKAKEESAIRDSESFLEKARQWRTRLDETTAKLNCLQDQHRMVLQVALQQNKLLNEKEENKSVMSNPSLTVTSQISIEYLQKRVVDLENRLKKYEGGSALIPDEVSPLDLKLDYTAIISKSPTVCGSPTVQKFHSTNETNHTFNAIEQQLKSEVGIVAELIERNTAPASAAVKPEPSTTESERTLLSEPTFIDLTDDDLDFAYIFASRPPSPSSSAPAPSGTVSSSLFLEPFPALPASAMPTTGPILNTAAPPQTSLSSYPPQIRQLEENALKRSNQDDIAEERPHKRPFSQNSGPSSPSASGSLQSKCSQPSGNVALNASQQESLEEGEVLGGTTASAALAVLPQESLEDGEVLDGVTASEVTNIPKSQDTLEESECLGGVNNDVSTSFGREDALADGAEESDSAPELNSMHMEILYHKSSKSGEYRCRLCLLEADAGWLAKEAAAVFPADVEREDMVLHSATAHAQALIGLLQTDKTDLISTVRKLYSSDMS